MRVLKLMYKTLNSQRRYFELYMSLRSLAWGLILLLSTNTFSTSHAYSIMKGIAPEYVWGIFAVVIGLMLFISNAMSSYTMRRVSLFLIIIQWSFITLAFLLSSVVSTALSVYTWDLAFSVWLLYKVGEQQYGR